jgi:hypothetical protein
MACSLLAIAEISSRVLHCAGEWAIDAFGKTCREWRQLVTDNRASLLQVLPRAVFKSCTSVKPTPSPSFGTPTAVLLVGELTLDDNALCPEGSRRIWSTVGSNCSRFTSLSSEFSPTSEGLMRSPFAVLCSSRRPAGMSCWGAGVAVVEGQLYLFGGWVADEAGSATSESSGIWDEMAYMMRATIGIPYDTRSEVGSETSESSGTYIGDEWTNWPLEVACRMWEVAGMRTSQLSICAHAPQYKRTSLAELSDVVLNYPNWPLQTHGCAWRFDCAAGSWEPLEPLWEMKAEAAVGVLAGHIYVCGGMDDSHAMVATCARFDPLTGEWEDLPDLLCARAWAAAGVAGA